MHITVHFKKSSQSRAVRPRIRGTDKSRVVRFNDVTRRGARASFSARRVHAGVPVQCVRLQRGGAQRAGGGERGARPVPAAAGHHDLPGEARLRPMRLHSGGFRAARNDQARVPCRWSSLPHWCASGQRAHASRLKGRRRSQGDVTRSAPHRGRSLGQYAGLEDMNQAAILSIVGLTWYLSGNSPSIYSVLHVCSVVEAIELYSNLTWCVLDEISRCRCGFCSS